jgi:hypothetical protein
MKTDPYSAPVSRLATSFPGLALTTFAAALLVFGRIGVYRLVQGPAPTDLKDILGIVVMLGIGLGSVGVRLLTDGRRRDGGLFSPWTPRLGGMIFVVAPVILIFAQPFNFGALEKR